MSFELFGPETKCDISVGYISTDRGLVEGINLYEANQHAKLNPGTQFIFRNRDKVNYLNINEVNKLKPADMLPSKNSANDKCSGIVGLNLEGDTTKSIDDAFDVQEALTGGTTKRGARDGNDKTEVNFYGGGGVGVQASPIIGIDGSILAVQVIHGGYGYKYPPIVDISDDTGQGAGVNAKAIIKTKTSDEDVFVEEYDAEEDYEEYDLETCAPELEKVGFGQRWGSDGKDLGKWNPSSYLNPGIGTFRQDPIRYEIERYQQFLLNLKEGTIIQNGRIMSWWTTRQKPPLRVTSADKVTRDVYDVFHWAWGSVPATNDSIDNLYIKLFGRNGDKRGLEYWKDLRSKGQSLGQIEEGMKTFPEWKEVCFGKCKPVMPAKTVFGNQYFEYNKDNFMNKYAISPVPQSNVAASDNAGKSYALEWEEEFPWDGDYVFNVQCDNEAHLYIDNDMVGEKIVLGSGGAAGATLSPPQKIKKFMSAGMRKITLDIINLPTKEKKKIQKDVVPTSDEVVFTVKTASLFANGIEIPDLGIDVSKEYGDGRDIKETHTKKVEYGRVYPVKVRSSNQLPSTSNKGIDFSGLDASNNPINVTSNGTRLALKDSSGSDENASFVITKVTGGSAKFSADGKSIDAKGDKVQVTLSLSWNDDPTIAGVAVQRIKIGSTTWTYGQGKTESRYTYVTRGDQGVAGFNEFDIITPGITPKKSWALANTADRYDFVKKRWEVKDSKGKWLPTTWEDLERFRGGDEGWIGIPAPKPPGRQMSTEGSETHTITLGGVNKSRIQLKTKGEKVLLMEDWTDESWDDLVCSVNNGRFYGISGSSCNFIVDPPAKKANSTGTQKGERAHVFNTIDFIKKANRKLWKINPSAGKDADFSNQFGVLPFDPTEVAKVEKKRSKTVEVAPTGAPPSVKFEVGSDGKNYLRVTGNGRVKVGLELNVNDNPRRSGLALREVKIQADDGEILMKREWVTKATDRGIGIFSAGKKYEVKALGGSKGAGSQIGVDKTSIGYDDNIGNGYDQNANVKITSITPLSTTKQVEESVLGYPDYPNASTDDYAGFHEIIWNNITFPEDGNYAISTAVDDNVVLTFSGKSPHANKKDVVLDKKGFRIRGDGRTGTGKSVEIKYFKSGTYTIKAVLEQIPGASLANGNPMLLAVDVKAAFISDDVEVVSAKSWNQNPFGVAMTIDAPMAPVPKEPPQLQEGRCPNNPIWSTRSPADKTWYPVRVDDWAKFMNRYAISPIPPLGLKGTDGAGTVYRNSWKVELPYRGFYGVKGTADNFGKLFIDGVEVLGPDVDKKFDNYDNSAPKAKKILLEKKTVDITVEIENEKQLIWQSIDKKVFSTADWASKQTQTEKTIEGPKNVDVTFKVSSSAGYANNIDMRGVFSVGKSYGGPNFNETYNRNIEVGKVYDVVFTSNNQAQRSTRIPVVYKGLNAANNPINVSNGGKTIKLKDGDGNDTNATITIDKTDGGSVTFTDDGKGFKVTGGTAAKRVLTTITLSWNDARRAGRAIDSFSVADKTWTRKGSSGVVTKSVYIYPPNAGNNQNNNSNIRLRNKGKSVVQMEDWTDNDWADIIASATEGEFYNMVGNTCKFRVPPKNKTEIVYGKGLTPGSSKDGVSYSGPPISTYGNSKTLGALITPTWNTDEEYIAEFNGKTWTMTWSGVSFEETGTYDIQAEVDDSLIVKIDGVDVLKAEGKTNVNKGQFNATEGKKTVEIVLTNLDFNAEYARNPTVAGVKITKKVQVAKVDPKSGTALGKPWTVNPIGVSAILIPPPCPKKINGVGIVTAVVITDPGNGFSPPITPPEGDPPLGPPVILELDEVIPQDPGINYSPDDQVCIINTETGEERCFIPPKGPFGEIEAFKPGGSGYRSYPQVIARTSTGISYVGIPILKPVIDPIGVEPDRLIQVTDLPGLKRTGYYNGRPYYGAVFYEDGIRYAGYYDTPGQKVQIYDTMQESIDAEVTTPPSAIQRQGTDINSNDPRLNIPGTPDNLT